MIEYAFHDDCECVSSTKHLRRRTVSISDLIQAGARRLGVLQLQLDEENRTHIDNHVSDDLIVGNKLGMLLFCFEKAIEKVVPALTEFRVLHALHETLDREASSDGEVIELVQRTRPMWVFPKPFV